MLSKIFEKLFLYQISKFIEKYNLLNSNQFGFRKGMSTIDAIESLLNIIIEDNEGLNQTLSVSQTSQKPLTVLITIFCFKNLSVTASMSYRFQGLLHIYTTEHSQ